MLTFAYFGADAFVTLAIVTVRHHSLAEASIAVTGSTLGWTAGSWIQAQFNQRWEGRRLVRSGLTLIMLGGCGMLAVLVPGVPVPLAFLAWSIAGLGMGLAYAPISLMMLREAPSGREGWASASLNLSDVLGSSLGAGLGGAAIAVASTQGWSLPTGLAVAFALPTVMAAAALVVSGRLPVRVTDPAIEA